MLKFLAWLFRPRTCLARGCGHQVQGNDDRCAICRLRLEQLPCGGCQLWCNTAGCCKPGAGKYR